MNQIPTAVTGQPERVEIPLPEPIPFEFESKQVWLESDIIKWADFIQTFNPKVVLHYSPLPPSPSLGVELAKRGIDSTLLSESNETKYDLCFHADSEVIIFDMQRVYRALKPNAVFILHPAKKDYSGTDFKIYHLSDPKQIIISQPYLIFQKP